MTRKVFDQELDRMHSDIASLGARVEDIIGRTKAALQNYDIEEARDIHEKDYKINAAQNTLEQQCVNLIALQQPLASDLRGITGTLKMVTDIERVADQCADICEIVLTYPELKKLQVPQAISSMFDRSKDMFARAIDSFLRVDQDLAKEVREADDEVDALFSRVVIEMTEILKDDQALVAAATDYMFIAKYLERMADHATNIAEWAIYLATGEHRNLGANLVDGKA